MTFTIWKSYVHLKYYMTIPVGFLPALRQITKMPAAKFLRSPSLSPSQVTKTQAMKGHREWHGPS